MAMFGKFRPPLLRKDGNQTRHQPKSYDGGLQASKRRKIDGTSSQSGAREGNEPSVVRQQMTAIECPKATANNTNLPSEVPNVYYNVLWRKYTNKKHKTWDGDGVLRVVEGQAYLRDISGREMGKTTCDRPLLPSSSLSIGGLEVEVDSVAKGENWANATIPPQSVPPIPVPKKNVKAVVQLLQSHHKDRNSRDKHANVSLDGADGPTTGRLPGPKPQGNFKTPLIHNTVLSKLEGPKAMPRHDPCTPGALVMERPRHAPPGKKIVDVVVDPLVTSNLRPHQREGVLFLYECVMGLREAGMYGAIMADEMGLGKTFQTITLLWTLLKQNPVYGDPPVVKKALIVCPVTLINNWRKEFRKWLGLDRIGVFVFDDNNRRLTDFTKGRSWSVMIIGYEKLRSVSEELRAANCVDIVIADEGHRLKTAKNKSAQAIVALNVPKKIVLSGTPMQNDLGEFFVVADFVNPGVLGTQKTFTKKFEVPILKSRQPAATQEDIEKGKEAGEELANLTKSFILRRTADILSKYLPSKTEYVLMCRPTKTQTLLYEQVLSSTVFQSAIGSSEAALQLITILKKVCNSPFLLSGSAPETDIPGNERSLSAALLADLPPNLVRNNQGSAKLRTLDRLLSVLSEETSEKVVIVSNYTSTLSILESFLTTLGYSYLRLDGSTPARKRQNLVDDFNRSDASTCFAFLLSAKAGGLGLNLIGASRLVLFDVDWNPATDLQAMARIHRDGQRRPCKIYRLFLAGGLDEKIWQRQVTKLGLANNIMDQKTGVSSFTKDELRDLFKLDRGPSCQTHSLLNCNCKGRGIPIAVGETVPDQSEEENFSDLAEFVPSNKFDFNKFEGRNKATRLKSQPESHRVDSLMSYMHFDVAKFPETSDADLEALIDDEILVSAMRDEENRVSFIFAKSSSQI